MRAVSVWSLLAMVLRASGFLAGREETGEKREGKGFCDPVVRWDKKRSMGNPPVALLRFVRNNPCTGASALLVTL